MNAHNKAQAEIILQGPQTPDKAEQQLGQGGLREEFMGRMEALKLQIPGMSGEIDALVTRTLGISDKAKESAGTRLESAIEEYPKELGNIIGLNGANSRIDNMGVRSSIDSSIKEAKGVLVKKHKMTGPHDDFDTRIEKGAKGHIGRSQKAAKDKVAEFDTSFEGEVTPEEKADFVKHGEEEVFRKIMHRIADLEESAGIPIAGFGKRFLLRSGIAAPEPAHFDEQGRRTHFRHRLNDIDRILDHSYMNNPFLRSDIYERIPKLDPSKDPRVWKFEEIFLALQEQLSTDNFVKALSPVASQYVHDFLKAKAAAKAKASRSSGGSGWHGGFSGWRDQAPPAPEKPKSPIEELLQVAAASKNGYASQVSKELDTLAAEHGVDKALKIMVRSHHPDANPGDPKAEERFKAVGELNDARNTQKGEEVRKREGTTSS